ncbi:MAG: ASKHA domain-containing protein [Spirochaetota bacterium]
MSVAVLFEPVGTAVEVEPGRTLLEAARDAEISLGATCGGRGTCGKCQVRVLEGPLPPATAKERGALSEGALSEGWRLACQYEVTAAVKAEAFLVRSRAKGEAPPFERGFAFAPPVQRRLVEVPPPRLDQPTSDFGNLSSALSLDGGSQPRTVDFQVARELSEMLRAAEWKVVATLRGDELIGVRPSLNARISLGLAVDLGTTNIAAYLYRMDDASLLGVFSAPNPLSAYGADIISRLAYSSLSMDNRMELQHVLTKAVNILAGHATREQGCDVEDIDEMVVVGNSGMHHLFLGLPGHQLTRAPFVAALDMAVSVKARELGIGIARGGYVYMPPLVGGFVGSDLLAVALATRIDQRRGARLALDIGTNTELLLSVDGVLYCCSTASGPALEGSALRFGTVASPGSIDAVWSGAPKAAFECTTIDRRPATGICGSGIIDLLACLVRSGLVSRTGRLVSDSPLVLPDPAGNHHFVVAQAASTALGEDLTISQDEIRSLQLAKGAIRAGIDTLLAVHGLGVKDLDEFLVAGTFGNHLHVESAVAIGLYPDIPRDRIRQIGNAAGTGAVLQLLSEDERRVASELSRSITHLELSLQPGFRKCFARSQWFPEEGTS